MRKTVAAYVTDNSVPLLRVGDLMKLDILYYAFSKVQDGKPGLYGLQNPALIAGLRKINPALKVVVSIGGWGAGGFSEAAMTAEGRAIFTQAAMEYIRAYDFDGIDMDWEYPCSSAADIASHPNDKYHFTELLESLRNALDEYGRAVGRSMHLSAAVGASADCIAGMEPHKVGRLLDHVNLMTYDMRSGGWGLPAGHHTNLYAQTGDEAGQSADKTVREYAEAGIPIGKMVLGAAFYGRVWLETSGINQMGRDATTLRYTDIYRRCLTPEDSEAARAHNADLCAFPAGDTGYTRYWDAQACAAYLYNGANFISYDDEASLTEKCRYVAEKNLAGIMFWEYGGDHTGNLLNVLTDSTVWNGAR